MMQIPWKLALLLTFLHPRAFVGVGSDDDGGIAAAAAALPSNPSWSRDYIALQTWKSAITEDPKGILASWVGYDVCSYRGVFCSPSPEEGVPMLPSPATSNVVVSGIDLNHGSLKGTLVSELALLTHLSILHLNSNRFSGSVPGSFGSLQFLAELDLSNNLLSGLFPTPALLIPNLIYLDLRFNSFSGEIPEELFDKGLDAIFLNNNQFQGQIPMSLWGSPASVITLANNRFSGPVPSSFGYGDDPAIREILFINNKLTGCIPEGLGYLSGIQVLDLSFNSLSGHVPDSLSCLSGIEVLNLGHNRLSGELTDLVCSIKSLLNLTVAYNFFSGFGQSCAEAFTRNDGFDSSGNCIAGWGMQRPPMQCMGMPGGGDISCLRIPSVRPMGCPGGGGGGGAMVVVGTEIPGMEITIPATASLPLSSSP